MKLQVPIKLKLSCGEPMASTVAEGHPIYARRTRGYTRLITILRGPQAIRAFFAQSALINRSSGKSCLRILDAGCGTGMETLALRAVISEKAPAQKRGCATTTVTYHAFDVTPAMLDVFREQLRAEGVPSEEVSLVCADVLKLGTLPASWGDYDIIVTAYMLEYLPRETVAQALKGLRFLLKDGGCILVCVAKRNCLTRQLFGRWWGASLYSREEVEIVMRQAGFSGITFRRLTPAYRHLSVLTHIVEASK